MRNFPQHKDQLHSLFRGGQYLMYHTVRDMWMFVLPSCDGMYSSVYQGASCSLAHNVCARLPQ